MTELTERQWQILHAAMLETPHDIIQDCMGGAEGGSPTDEEIDEVFTQVAIMAGAEVRTQ